MAGDPGPNSAPQPLRSPTPVVIALTVRALFPLSFNQVTYSNSMCMAVQAPPRLLPFSQIHVMLGFDL